MALKINRKGTISAPTQPVALQPFGFPSPVTSGRELGRISGPLLADNLLRNKENLAFDSSVLYLDVNNNFVGFNTATPTRNLNIFGKSLTTNLIIDHQADIAHITFKTNKIQNSYNENIIISPNQSSNPTVYTNGLGTTDHLTFINNELNAKINTNIVFDPTGATNINSSAYVDGNLHSTGDITFDGNINFGNEASDTINLAAEISTSILPVLDGVYNLGGSLHLRVPNDPGFNTNTSLNYFYATKASWEASSGHIGFTITDVKFMPGTTITNVQGPQNDLGYDFYVIFTSTNQLVDISQNDYVDIDSKNWLSFYSTNFNTGSITSTNANLTTLTAGNIRFNANTISNIVSGNDLNLITTGIGTVRFNDFLKISSTNVISHTDNTTFSFLNNVVGMSGRATGYVKFSGDTGIVIPTGNTLQRPVGPEIGTMRYNSNLNYVEVYANVENTSTVILAVTSADAIIGDSILYTITTSGMIVGDFASSTSVPGAFASDTIILNINPNVSVSISKPLIANLPNGSNLSVQHKWIPIIGTSPVLSETVVNEVMDIWALILG
jgi:hypothetical protein